MSSVKLEHVKKCFNINFISLLFSNVNINGFIWIYGVFELVSTIFLSKKIFKNTILVSLFLMLLRLENQGICLVMISYFKIFSINVTKAMFGLSRWYIGPNNLL